MMEIIILLAIVFWLMRISIRYEKYVEIHHLL